MKCKFTAIIFLVLPLMFASCVSSKKYKEAEMLLQKAISKIPTAGELYYALTFVYLQTNNMVKARQSGLALKQLDPDNADYQELYQKLGL